MMNDNDNVIHSVNKDQRKKSATPFIISILALIFGFVLFIIVITTFIKISSVKDQENKQDNQLASIRNRTKIFQQQTSKSNMAKIKKKQQMVMNQTKILRKKINLLNLTKQQQKQQTQTLSNQTTVLGREFKDLHLHILPLIDGQESNDANLEILQDKKLNVPNVTSSSSGSGFDSSIINHRHSCFPSVTFHLTRDNQKSDYIRYRGYFPSLKEATICTWIESVIDNKWRAIFGYGTSSSSDELVLFTRGSTFSLKIQRDLTEYEATNFPSNQSKAKYQLCLWFSTITRETGFYLNNTRAQQRTLHSNSTVRGGGKFLLGHEFDTNNSLSSIDRNQVFIGNITSFMIWPRVLSDEEISKFSNECKCPTDHVLAMNLQTAEINGESFYSIPEDCPAL